MNKFYFLIIAIFLTNTLLAFQTTVELDTSIEEVNGITIYKATLEALDGLPHTHRENFVHEVFTYDKNGEEKEWVIKQGIVYKMIPSHHAERLYELLHDEVLSAGSFLFLTNQSYDPDFNSYLDIVILPGTDPYRIIKDMGVMAVNYDMYTADIITKLKEWDKELGLQFETIDGDIISAYMTHLPENAKSFAKEVYDFCPDVVDQGVTMRELVRGFRKYPYVYLWWD